MQVKETELFKKFSLLLLDKNKEHFDEIKDKLSLYSNVKLDNSGAIRAIIEFLYDNQELLQEIAPYAIQYKGFSLLEEFTKMVKDGRTPKEIEEKLGVSASHYDDLKKKYPDDLS